MKIKILWLIITWFIFAGSSFGQPKAKKDFAGIREITSGNFYAANREASELASAVNHRKIDKSEYSQNGKLYSTEEITEVLAPDKKRILTVEKENDLIKQEELIKIGDVFYCRKENGDWKQSKVWCGRSSFRAIPNVEIVSKYTVEVTKLNNQTVKFYQEVTTYLDKAERKYWKSKFWVNEKGLIIREEYGIGLVEPETATFKGEVVYEYNPKNLKIEAPTIKTETKSPPK